MAVAMRRSGRVLVGAGRRLTNAAEHAAPRVTEAKPAKPAKPPKPATPAIVQPPAESRYIAGVAELGIRVKIAPERRLPKRLPVDELRADLESRLEAQLAPLAERSGPVIAGPFVGEVGFELLYWIPFLRWAVARFPSLRGRLTVVSRGGTGGWYRGLDADYVDVLSIISPEQLVAQRAALKQRELSELDETVYTRVAADLGVDACDGLHPALLFNTFYSILKVDERAYVRAIAPRPDGVIDGLAAAYEQSRASDLPAVRERLPDEYAAVRFYFRPSFRDTPENRAFARSMVERISRRIPVVLLNNRMELDDHHDFHPGEGDRVITLDDLMVPENNLAVQTSAVACAKVLVGTYGGLSYLAPFLGVPAISFTADAAWTRSCHLELAQAIFGHDGWGSLISLRLGDPDALSVLAPGE